MADIQISTVQIGFKRKLLYFYKCHIGFAQQTHQYRCNCSNHNGHNKVGGCSLSIAAYDIG